ncbi:MAG: helix-turn-helix transcriptional regulator [Bacteroidota bacterium]
MIDRIKLLLEHYKLSPSGFADSLGIPRSSISHLLSGRNKPSLDFILKLIGKYPEVNLYWLLKGEGSFPSNSSTSNSPAASTFFDSYAKAEEPSSSDSFNTTPTNSTKRLTKVVLFYNDGTFQSFEAEK